MGYPQYASRYILSQINVIKTQSLKVRKGLSAEPLHQIRVALRKLDNAFLLFKDLIPKKNLAFWRDEIMGVSRLTSKARDLDVLIIYLNAYKKNLPHQPKKVLLNSLIASLVVKRQALQPKIVNAVDLLRKNKIIIEIEKYFIKVAQKKETRDDFKVYAVARIKIFKRVKKVVAYRKIIHRANEVKALHEMRIANKKLRYALETFHKVYGRTINLYLTPVLGFHERLGKIHDYDVWIEHLEKDHKNIKKDVPEADMVDKLIVHCRKQRLIAYRSFIRFWDNYRRKYLLERLVQHVYTYRRKYEK